MSERELSLEEVIQLANKIGLEHVDKRKEAERLELLRTSVRAQIMNRIELESTNQQNPKGFNENKLKRLAEAAPEYMTLLEEIVFARAEAEKLKIRYDSYRNLFEAKRTMISYKKMELKVL